MVVLMNKKLKIMFILNHFYPEVGAVRTEYELSKKLAELGHDVMVITTYPRAYRLPEQFKSFFIKLYREKKLLIEKHGPLKIVRIKSYISKRDDFKQRILELLTSIFMLSILSFVFSLLYNPNVIIIGGDLEPIVSTTAYPQKFLLKKRTLMILHDITSQQLTDVGLIKRKSLKYHIIRMLERLMFRYIDKIVVHSPSNKKLLIKLGATANKIHTIYLWADLDKIRPLNNDRKDNCMLKKKDFLVYYGGVLSYPQGPEIIVEVAKILKDKKIDNVQIVIAGDGPMKPEMIKKAEKYKLDNITFLPFQPWKKHIEILRCADMALVLLRKEYKQPVVPSKLIEIMAAGVIPILSVPYHSDAKKIAVDEAKAGIWVPPEQPERLAEAIIGIIRNENIKQLKESARKYAEENFRLDMNAKRYLDILVNIVDKKSTKNVL